MTRPTIANTGWGFVGLDPTRPYLFLARRENGLSVFDVKQQRLVETVAQSEGANGVVFVPEVDRVFVLNTDGSLSVVELSTLTFLKRIPVAQSNLNSAVYEPSTGKVIIVSGRRADRSTLFEFDPKQERITGAHELAVKKIDPLLIKGDGSFFLPMRDEGKVARYSAMPVLIVADRKTGEVKAKLPITRDVNALAYDEQHRRLLIPSGVDANLTLVDQTDADHYAVRASVSTLPMAYNMAFDPASQRVFLPAMDFTQPAPSKAEPKPDPLFHANTFSVTTYGP
eukprot:gene20310-24126_t